MPKTKKIIKNIAFVASGHRDAQEAAKRLIERYGNTAPEKSDAIIALGGDGLMLQTLHAHMDSGIPIYGMHCGSIGFLMNEYNEENLPERLTAAKTSIIHPLRMKVRRQDGKVENALAINEIALFRATYQAAKLRIYVDGKMRMEEMICDGVLVATPAGSTAYNHSAYGPIIPINAQLLALTPISPFRPRRWRGALLPNTAKVRVEVLEAEKRPVNAVADHTEFQSICCVEVEQDGAIDLHMMFDRDHALDERILTEQFLY